MARPSNPKSAPVVIRCAKCGKEIPPNAMGIPCECVWRDGVYFCFDCNGKYTPNAK